ncbi:hypothetical protein KAX29_05105 [candidate division WOR-3 bacterium]|nr:hypothetical protein [candidate division WOR-3 bacterium]MCK4321778.1 hypothetical protein [candidate division WOR-3 bacterium]
MFRIIKWVVYIGLAYLLYGTEWFWVWVIGLPVAGLTMHFIYRCKTKGRTKSWGRWEKRDSYEHDRRYAHYMTEYRLRR